MEKRFLKRGDSVECLDDKSMLNVTVGKTYEIIKSAASVIHFKNDKGEHSVSINYNAWRLIEKKLSSPVKGDLLKKGTVLKCLTEIDSENITFNKIYSIIKNSKESICILDDKGEEIELKNFENWGIVCYKAHKKQLKKSIQKLAAKRSHLSQNAKLAEECCELGKDICKLISNDNIQKNDKVLGEIADVLNNVDLYLEQLGMSKDQLLDYRMAQIEKHL